VEIQIMNRESDEKEYFRNLLKILEFRVKVGEKGTKTKIKDNIGDFICKIFSMNQMISS